MSTPRFMRILLIAAITCLRLLGQATILSAQEQPDPEAIYNSLRVTAREFVAGDSGTALVRPEITLNSGERIIYFNLGRVKPSGVGLSEGDPYQLPIETLIRIEALRQVYEPDELGRRFVSGHLETLERTVFQTIVDLLATEQDPPRRLLLLAERGGEVDEEFQKIEQGIRDYARENGLQARRAGRGLASDYYSVRVSTAPPGGTISVIPWLEYRKRLALGYREDQLPWRTLGQQNEDLVGRYVCRIQWSNGQSYRGEFHVRNASDLRLPRR